MRTGDERTEKAPQGERTVRAHLRAPLPPPQIEVVLPEGVDPAEVRHFWARTFAEARREVRIARGAGP